MEPEVIHKLMKQTNESLKEMKILYELTEIEMGYIGLIVMDIANLGLDPKTAAKVLRAASHWCEASDEILTEFFKNK